MLVAGRVYPMLEVVASEHLSPMDSECRMTSWGVFSPGSLKRGTKGYFKSWHQTFAWRHA